MKGLLLDSSAWVEYLRATGSPTALAVKQLLLERPDQVLTTEPVAMELLAGARPSALGKLERLVESLPVVTVDPTVDFPAAASAYRTARAGGRTVRSLVDCLIAAVAVRHRVELVHRDADFDVLARVLVDLRTRSFG